MNCFDPTSGPFKVLVRRSIVIIDVVVITNVERRVSENEIDGTRVDVGHTLYAVALQYLIGMDAQRSPPFVGV